MSKSDESPLLGLGRIIAFHRGFVDLTGSVHGALLLSQALYWQGHTKASDGWWHKTKEEWELEIGLSRRYLDSATRDCSKWLFTELRGMPARSFWHLELQLLESDLIELSTGQRQTSLAVNAKQDWRQTPNKVGSESQSSLAANAKQYIRSGENTDYTTRLQHKTTTTTTEPQPVQSVVVATDIQNVCGSGVFQKNGEEQTATAALIFPSCYKSEDERLATAALISRCGNAAQSVLDVLQAAINAGEVRKSPGAFLSALVRRFEAGTFDASPGFAIAEQRKAKVQQIDREALLIRQHEIRLQRYAEKRVLSPGTSEAMRFKTLPGANDQATAGSGQ